MRSLVLVFALAACSDPDPKGCDVEQVLVPVGEEDPIGCGFLSDESEPAELAAAHDCVAAAIAAEQSFIVLLSITGIDSQITLGYSASVTQDGYTLFSIFSDSDPTGGGGDRPFTQLRSCGELTDLGACAEIADNLCFSCADSEVIETCRTE